MNRLLPLALVLLAAASTAAGQTLRELLDRYTGRWTGTVEVVAADGRTLTTFTVEQQYWWDGEEQHAVAVFSSNGKLTTVESRIHLSGGSLFADVISSTAPPRRHAARVRDTTITWIPTDAAEAGSSQVRETIVIERGVSVLHTEGIELAGPKGRETPVRVVGRLVKVPEGSPGPAEPPRATGPNP